jgi:CubicO group peptidase (beta-lactamase class C family)
MKDGQELLHVAAGKQDVEANKDIKIDSLFRIASQTKALKRRITLKRLTSVKIK